VSVKTFFPRLQTATEFKCGPTGCKPIRKPEPDVPREPLQKVIPEKVTVTALNGHSISRCAHGSYWVENERHSGPIYCESCNPGASLRMVGSQDSPMNRWVIPRKHLNEDRTFANPAASHGSAGQCPGCHCQVHEVLPSGKWRCPDCGHVWKGAANATAA
jgi:hypothetical protein